MKRTLTWSVAALAAVALTFSATALASAQKRFSVSGIQLHFNYPSSFRLGTVTSVKTHVGSSSQKQVALVLDKANLLAVISYPKLRIAVTAKNVKAVSPQFNAVLTQAFGRRVSGRVSVDHGVPLISYPALLTNVPGGKGYDQVYYAFDNTTAYELLCQWTKGAYQSQVQAGCRQMISTLSK